MTDRSAIVTGAADGIGRATALSLAAVGFSVVAVDIDKVGLAGTSDLIREAGGSCDVAIADVSEAEAVQSYVDLTLRIHGRIDGFFNNAGLLGAAGPITEYDEDSFDRVVAVNLRGVFLGLKYVLREMVRQGSGSVVNTASMGAVGGIPGLGAYVATKHGVLGLTRTAALDVAASGVRVNAVLPGNIRTKMAAGGSTDEAAEQAIAHAASFVPQGRVGEPHEIAELVRFLLGDGSAHITGAAVPVDGGITATVYGNSN